MSADSLEDLFVDGLQKIYYTEKQLLDALEELESDSSEERVKEAFSEHRQETQTHVERLEEAFEQMDRSAETKQDRVVDAMIEEHEEFTSENPDEKVLERFNIAAGQKSEHYEIASYGNLIPLADQLGLEEVADLLEENLREEQEALDELSQVGEEFDYGEIESSA
jgi:ferritin-like metal-binding protein YciE